MADAGRFMVCLRLATLASYATQSFETGTRPKPNAEPKSKLKPVFKLNVKVWLGPDAAGGLVVSA
jgi:hypothetical protein